jgi:hypothetical protein
VAGPRLLFLGRGGIIIIKIKQNQKLNTKHKQSLPYILLSKYVEDNKYYLENARIFVNIVPCRICIALTCIRFYSG